MAAGPIAAQQAPNFSNESASRCGSREAASRSASDSPMLVKAARQGAGATAFTPSAAARNDLVTRSASSKAPDISRSSASGIMSPAISAARSGFSSMRRRSVIRSTDRLRTLSCLSVSTHCAHSGGTSQWARRSARSPAPASAAW